MKETSENSIPEEQSVLRRVMDDVAIRGAVRGRRVGAHSARVYSCHIEYDYMGKGDCIDLSTLDDTYSIYPTTKECCATKISLAVEELYRFISGRHE